MAGKKNKIIPFGDPLLREVAKPVRVIHKKIYQLIDSMQITLDNCDDGAAVAANQVGVLKRITVIDYEHEYFEMINPEILSGEGEQIDFEGCLSFPGYVGLVSRAEKIKVKYLDRNGSENFIERNGNLARCIQHEIDHLDGILFIDRVKENHLIHSGTKTKIDLDPIIRLSKGIIG